MPLNRDQLKRLAQRLKSRQLTAEDETLVIEFLQSYRDLIQLLKDPATSWEDVDRYLLSHQSDEATGGSAADRNQGLPQGGEESIRKRPE